MAIVLHRINNNRYAYHHYRVGKSIRTKYIGPVDNKGRVREVKHGDSVERVPVGTTTESLKKIYLNAVRLKNQTNKGKTINNNKDVSRFGQETQEISTMESKSENVFVATGDTYEKKDELKSAGMKWDPQQKHWWSAEKPYVSGVRFKETQRLKDPELRQTIFELSNKIEKHQIPIETTEAILKEDPAIYDWLSSEAQMKIAVARGDI